ARSGPYGRREKGRTATTQGTQERDASKVVNGEMRDGQMMLAGALVLLVIGTVLFYFLSPWWLTPIASNWDTIDETMHVTFWVTGVVFVSVNLFLAYAIVRYRHRKGLKAHYEPENRKLEWGLTIATSVGI